MYSSKPLFMYCPTKILWVGAKTAFFEELVQQNMSIIQCNDEQEALNHLQNQRNFNTFSEWIKPVNLSELDQEGISISIDFNDVAIYLAHHAQTELTSLVIIALHPSNDSEVFTVYQKIRQQGLRTLLLHDESNIHFELAAFQHSAIDRLIRTDEDSILNILREEKIKFLEGYFNGIMQVFGVSLDLPFENPKYMQKFNDALNRSQAIAYCLIDPYGSYLFMDKHGNKTILVCQREEELQRYIELAEMHSENNALREELKENGNILFLFPKERCYEPISAWMHYLHPSERISLNSRAAIIEEKHF